MIRFVKIMLLIFFSFFLTKGSAFAHIQSAQKMVSCCKSPSENKTCCKKNKTSKSAFCKDPVCCAKIINNIVFFSEVQQDFNLQTTVFKGKQQPSTVINLHLKNPFLAVWQKPKISLNL